MWCWDQHFMELYWYISTYFQWKEEEKYSRSPVPCRKDIRWKHSIVYSWPWHNTQVSSHLSCYHYIRVATVIDEWMRKQYWWNNTAKNWSTQRKTRLNSYSVHTPLKSPTTTLDRRLGGPQTCSRNCAEENMSTMLEFKPYSPNHSPVTTPI